MKTLLRSIRGVPAALGWLVCAATLCAQAPEAKPPLKSPVVGEDGRVTVALRAPKAQEVKITSGELTRVVGAEGLKMTRGDDGTWSATFGPVPPGIYDFAFDVDGVRVTDPLSTNVFGNRSGSRGYIEVPGPKGAPRIDEWRDVPHGTVTTHWYPSKATGTRRRVHIYLPPTPPGGWTGYPALAAVPQAPLLPVVYLLHGSGDDDRHWSLLGQANVIADNLIAEKKMRPAIIVMPEGHPAGARPEASRDAEERKRYSAENLRLFENDLLEDVIPLVEANYLVSREPADRALVGLSMGGRQSLTVGLKHADKFAYIGCFSGGIPGDDEAVAKLQADPKAFNARNKLLWIGIGKDDGALPANRDFDALLTKAGIRHEYVETEGAHTWSVWRGYLAEFLPKLFRETKSQD
jgi:enterochelin esterase family protein